MMAHEEHDKPELPGHGEYKHKHTALWLIVTTLIVSIAVPLLLIAITIPR